MAIGKLIDIKNALAMKINGDRSMERHPWTKANYSAKYSAIIYSLRNSYRNMQKWLLAN